MPENIIIGFLLGSFTTLLGSLAAHFLSKDRDMKKGFNEAASIFRNTFERILATIKTPISRIVKSLMIFLSKITPIKESLWEVSAGKCGASKNEHSAKHGKRKGVKSALDS